MRRTIAKLAIGSAIFALGIVAVGVWIHEPASRVTATERAHPPSSSSDAVPGSVTNPPPFGAARPPLPSAPASGWQAPEAPLDEATLMTRLRRVEETDPALAIELARDGNRRFPESHDAPERASILIHSLARQGLASEARGEAEDMVNAYPDSPWVREIEQFTGAHRHRNLRLGEDGGIEFY